MPRPKALRGGTGREGARSELASGAATGPGGRSAPAPDSTQARDLSAGRSAPAPDSFEARDLSADGPLVRIPHVVGGVARRLEPHQPLVDGEDRVRRPEVDPRELVVHDRGRFGID